MKLIIDRSINQIYLGDVCQIDGCKSTIPNFSSRFCPKVSSQACNGEKRV